MMPEKIYKVVTADQWATAQSAGRFDGAPIDIRDGFIHFSAGRQLRETVDKHFGGVENLWLLSVDPETLGDRLKWEVSRGGQSFPHLYDTLNLDQIVDAVPLDDDAIRSAEAPS